MIWVGVACVVAARMVHHVGNGDQVIEPGGIGIVGCSCTNRALVRVPLHAY